MDMKISKQDIHNAADVLERQAALYEGMIAAARVLRTAATLQNRVDEGERRLVAIAKDIEAAQDHLNSLGSISDKAEAQAKQLHREAEDDKAAILRQARADAEATIAAAQQEVQRLHSVEEDAMRKMKAFALEAQKNSAAKVLEAEAAAVQFDKEIEAKSKQLAVLEVKLAKAKDAVKALLG